MEAPVVAVVFGSGGSVAASVASLCGIEGPKLSEDPTRFEFEGRFESFLARASGLSGSANLGSSSSGNTELPNPPNLVVLNRGDLRTPAWPCCSTEPSTCGGRARLSVPYSAI